MEKNNKDTIWNKDFILLLITNALVFISMHMLSTTIAKYAMTLRGTELLAGMIAGAFSITAIIVRPICGNLIDRKKKKTLYLIFVFVIFVSMLGYSVAKSNSMLFVCRLLHGVGWGFTTTIGMTMATNTAPENKIGEAASIYGLANVLAMAVAPTVGSNLSEKFSFQVMFLFAAFVVAVAFVCLLAVKDQPVSMGAPIKRISLQTLVLKEAIIPATVLLLSGMVYNAITTFLIVYAESVGIAKPSVFFTVYSVVILFVRLNSGKIVDRKGPEYILVPAGFFFCGCLLVLANLKNAVMLYVAAVLMGLGYSANLSTLMAVSFKRATPAQRGIASSTINIGMDIGTGIGSAVAGVLAEIMGYRSLYIVLCIPIIISTCLFVWDQKAFQRHGGLYRNYL